jgi:hypothetical protein
MRSTIIASTIITSCVLLSACSEETCAEGADCNGTGRGSTTSASSTSGTGGAGGSAPDTIPTEVVVLKPDGSPVPDVAVAANGADGALLSDGLTDADGVIVLGVPTGGSVSAFHTYTFFYDGQSYSLIDTVSAFVGDTQVARVILNVETAPSMPEPQAGEMAIGASASPKAGANSYEMYTGCAQETFPNTNMGFWHPNCTNDGLYDVVIAARDVGGRLLDYQILGDQPFVDGEKVAHDMFWPGSTIGVVPYSVSNIPEGAEALTVTSSSTRTTHGAPITLQQAWDVTLPAASEAGTVTAPIGFGSENCDQIRVELPAPAASRSTIGAHRCSPEVSLLPIQLDAARLARFQLEPTDTAETLKWTEEAAGDAGDVIQVYIGSASTTDAPNVRWSVTLPPGTLEITRPEVPELLAAYRVPASLLYGGVSNVDYLDRDGFADVLQNGTSKTSHFHGYWEL